MTWRKKERRRRMSATRRRAMICRRKVEAKSRSLMKSPQKGHHLWTKTSRVQRIRLNLPQNICRAYPRLMTLQRLLSPCHEVSQLLSSQTKASNLSRHQKAEMLLRVLQEDGIKPARTVKYQATIRAARRLGSGDASSRVETRAVGLTPCP